VELQFLVDRMRDSCRILAPRVHGLGPYQLDRWPCSEASVDPTIADPPELDAEARPAK
jgi:hypothetical protein